MNLTFETLCFLQANNISILLFKQADEGIDIKFLEEGPQSSNIPTDYFEIGRTFVLIQSFGSVIETALHFIDLRLDIRSKKRVNTLRSTMELDLKQWNQIKIKESFLKRRNRV